MARACRLQIRITGAVQGVGYRPFVYRLAEELGLGGWVANDTAGVSIEVEGPRRRIDRFVSRMKAESPPAAQVRSIEGIWLRCRGYRGFEIRPSNGSGAPSAGILPDLATCPECLREVMDPSDRHHAYPFTNCTRCGPRFTIIHELPYDRPSTSMRGFPMCPPCRAEYESPRDRRFHAQPNACPSCGPRLELWDRQGAVLGREDRALELACEALRSGRIVAVKGLGGFHLMADAAQEEAVARLREGKPRREKPFALMARDLRQAGDLFVLSPPARALLVSPAAPIVLLPRRVTAPVARSVAPGCRDLGVMLPATPLHHLLMRRLGRPVVATSGNLSDEPICTDEREALERLGGLAELFLVNDRPIARHADDSVVRMIGGQPCLLRRARGYAPLPLSVPRQMPVVLAVGGQLKSTVALAAGRQVIVSQHIGDLGSAEALRTFDRVIADLTRLYGAKPAAIAHDLHPDYLSTRWAAAAVSVRDGGGLSGARLVGVQHHHAHLAACLADNGIEGPALGVVWDGTGYGTDGTVWGGEFLVGDAGGYRRAAHLRPFRLPGGEAAVREPRRAAIGLLLELQGDAALEREDLAPVRAFDPAERKVLARAVDRRINAPVCTSAGRLFDAVAAMAGLRQVSSFEGQAAMELEGIAETGHAGAYTARLAAAPAGSALVLDWGELITEMLEDLAGGTRPGLIAARFHNALARGIVRVALTLGQPRVALTGGCFQNGMLAERTAAGLRAEGFEVLLHRNVPPNDGGLSLGQAMVAGAQLSRERAGGDRRRTDEKEGDRVSRNTG